MAGNETKITDIVGKEAFDQLERLDRKLADTQNVYIGDRERVDDKSLKLVRVERQDRGVQEKCISA